MEEENASNYRPSSTTQDQQPATVRDTLPEGRPSRQRASTACLSCRSRRVRCDVLLSGKPCNNCKLDGVNCVVTRSKRGKRLQRHSAAPQPPVPLSPALSGETEDLPMCLTFDARQANDGRPSSPGGRSYSSTMLMESTLQNQDKSPQISTSASATDKQLPAYIRPLPTNLSHADLECLRVKGALTVPDHILCTKLLQSFVHYVYPFLPIINLTQFLTSIQTNGREQPISLMLFQAVMFMGVGYVDPKLLAERGFRDHREARQVFFGRIRALYDADVEKDRMVLVQSLLIMSHWYNSPDDEKDTWYWMGLCSSLALVSGLHRNPESMRLTSSMKRLRKRLWWSCYMRDQLIGLGVRRPAHFAMTDNDVPLLELSDFETDPFPETVAQLFDDETSLPRSNTRTNIALACIDLSKLCTIISHILQSQYSILGDLRHGSVAVNQMVAPKEHSSLQLAHLVQCDQDLTEWLQSISQRTAPGFMDSGLPNSQAVDQVVFFHQSMLKILYFTAVAILHRPQVFQAARRSSTEEEQIEISQTKLMDAATSLTNIATDLETRGLVRYMPTSAIPALVSAILIHFVGIESKIESIRTMSIGRFYQSIHILSQLQSRYHSASSSISFILAVIRKHHIPIPMVEQFVQYQFQSPSRMRWGPDKPHKTLPYSTFEAQLDFSTQLDGTAPMLHGLESHRSPSGFNWSSAGLVSDRFPRQELQENYITEQNQEAMPDTARWADWEGADAILGSFPDINLDFPNGVLMSAMP